MTAPLELFVFPWGVYPRRVLLYLAEKGLAGHPHIKITQVDVANQMSAPGKPPGSVPVLRLPDGTFVKQSVAILEYLEDVCDAPDPSQPWQADLAAAAAAAATTATGSMRGGDAAARRARAREILALADEANSHFGLAAHKGARVFVGAEETDPKAARLAMEYCRKAMGLLEPYYADDELPLLERGGRGVTIADCVVFSLISFARGLYDVDLCSGPAGEELPSLRRFAEWFGKRESARLPEGEFYPAPIKELTVFIPESEE
ncbi:hypothetical protein RB601_005344 [Gaeumannomyces tritici]